MADEILDNGLEFDLPKNKSSIIKVIGVGGGGSNAVNHMKRNGINGVDFVICNTDAQALDHSPVENRIQLGANLTEGLGAGANPEVGRRAAEETKEEILEILKKNTKMVFITAGMGGGTGTGAAPVIARLAKELNILTVGIVTKPFKFEGRIREKQAIEGIEELRKNVDSLIVINNDKLREVYGNLSFRAGFAKADEVLATAAKGIAEVITYHFTTNIDLKDVRTVLEDSGTAIMGSALAGGHNRAQDAVMGALDSPLLNDNHIEGAKNVLLLIVSSGDEHEITMDEMSLINEHIQKEAGGDTNVIMGIGIDNELQSTISVTVIATGFPANRHNNLSGREPEKIVHPLDDDQPITKDIFDKGLTEINAPTKPFKKNINTQPDLFSDPLPPNHIVHGLYEEDEDDSTEVAADITPKLTATTHPTINPGLDDSIVEDTHHVTDDATAKEESILYEVDVTENSNNEDVNHDEIDELEDEFAVDFSETEVVTAENEIVFDIQNQSAETTLEARESLEENNEPDADAIKDENSDLSEDITFELDDIEGDGIYLATEPSIQDEAEPEDDDSESAQFEMRISDVLSIRESEENSIQAEDIKEETKEVTSKTTPASENNHSSDRVVHTLDDYLELEKRLQIKKDAEPTPSKSEKHQDAKEETEELVRFELKSKGTSNTENIDTTDEELFNKPISAAVHQKILERKNRLEMFNYKFKHATSELLEKEPAYKRQGLEVNSDNYSSQSTVSRMSLGGEQGEPEIRTNNSFLHDNVD